MRFARPLEYCVRGADANVRDRERHRPASTHDTGDHPVLLCPDEFLAVDDQNAVRTAIDDAQIRHAALLRNFRHFHQAQHQRIVEDAVARHSPCLRVASEQWIHGNSAEHDRRSNDD
jgi:hypothetical protein